MKFYLIAGEASGDLHGSNLIAELKQRTTDAEFRAWGGDLMAAQGAIIVKHFRELAFMGFAEVIMNLPTILRNLSSCKRDILEYQPDVLILIDYPGFNMRIAEWARKQGIRVVYYISPSVWAWKEGRVKKLKRDVDQLMVILPFEEAFYAERGMKVHYVGHPLMQVVKDHKASSASDPISSKPILALLPGSRKQEISRKLPVMLEAAKAFPDLQPVLAKAPGMDTSFYDQFLEGHSHVKILNNETYRLLSQATAAMVTSGTATLETALFGVPEVVCYKASEISFQVAKRLVNIKYISLVNLIMDREVVKELIQSDFTVENLVKEMQCILYDENRKARLAADYQALHEILSKGGNASAVAASVIMEGLLSASTAKALQQE